MPEGESVSSQDAICPKVVKLLAGRTSPDHQIRGLRSGASNQVHKLGTVRTGHMRFKDSSVKQELSSIILRVCHSVYLIVNTAANRSEGHVDDLI